MEGNCILGGAVKLCLDSVDLTLGDKFWNFKAKEHLLDSVNSWRSSGSVVLYYYQAVVGHGFLAQHSLLFSGGGTRFSSSGWFIVFLLWDLVVLLKVVYCFQVVGRDL